MSRKLTVLLSCILALLVCGCGVIGDLITAVEEQIDVTPSGDIVTREEDFSGFDEVDVSHAFKVNIEQGDEFSIVIRVDQSVLEYLQVEKRGDTLVIGLTTSLAFSFRDDLTMEADVTMPTLVGLELSGASRATITGFRSSESFQTEESGASTLTGDIQASSITIDASGASHVTLTGSAADAYAEASGASSVDLSDFPVADADVAASGASTITVDVSGRLDARASGASDVFYTGDPTLGDTRTSGASDIINLDD